MNTIDVAVSGTFILVLREMMTGITNTIPYAHKHHAIARAIKEVKANQNGPVEATILQVGKAPVWHLSMLEESDFTDIGKDDVYNPDIIDKDYWTMKGE